MNTTPKEMLLQDTFNSHGFVMKKVHETDSAYMYSKCWPGSTTPIGYEVFQRRIAKESTGCIDGRTFKTPAKEKFPGNEDFGDWAYSHISYDKAFDHVNGIQMHTSVKDVCGIPLNAEEEENRKKAMARSAARHKKAAV